MAVAVSSGPDPRSAFPLCRAPPSATPQAKLAQAGIVGGGASAVAQLAPVDGTGGDCNTGAAAVRAFDVMARNQETLVVGRERLRHERGIYSSNPPAAR